MTILALLAGVAVFLVIQALPAITASASELPDGKTLVDYIAPLVFGTVLAAILAVVIAVPLAMAVALFISHIAPKKLAQPLGYIVDLLAAIPSIVYGLWGLAVLGPATVPVTQWLTDHLSFIPFFAGPSSVTGRTMFTVGIVLALMILPIVSAVAREVFTQTPKKLQEGATGARRDPLGDDPDDRPAVRQVGGDQRLDARPRPGARGDDGRRDHPLGLGRGDVNLISSDNPSTVAANIALQFPESSGISVNVLIASGLVLFGITLIVNMIARAVIARQNVQ